MYMLQLFDAADPLHPVDARLLRDGVLRIGRDPAADWTIADAERAISRAHCELTAAIEGLQLRCQGANGVYDDRTGQRLPDDVDVPLALPFTFRIGGYRIAASRPRGRQGRTDGRPHDACCCRRSATTMRCPATGPTPRRRAPPPTHRCWRRSARGRGSIPRLLSAEEPAEVMRRAGAVYRQLVLGLGDLMTERERARERFRMNRTSIAGVGNNPFKWAPTQRLADRPAERRVRRASCRVRPRSPPRSAT